MTSTALARFAACVSRGMARSYDRHGFSRTPSAGCYFVRVRASWLFILLLVGCAHAPVRKTPLSEALAPPLPQAMEEFSTSATSARAGAKPGAAMPPSHVAAWNMLLSSIEGAPKTAALREYLSTQLQTDTRLFGDVPPELAERALAELRRLNPVQRAIAVNPVHFAWPVQPLIVSSPYGDRLHPVLGENRFHAGVDLEVPLATPVYAAFEGTVQFSGWNGAHGQQVELQHDAHWTTRYSHLQDLLVKPGAHVKKGEVIALSGQTGLATGPHLHFELRRDGDALDPEHFLPVPPSQLFSELR